MGELTDEGSDVDVPVPRGADLRVDLQLTFEEAAEGCSKVIAVTRRASCIACASTGFAPGTAVDCGECKGTGAVMHKHQMFGGLTTANCPRCRRGKVAKKCKACRGKGGHDRLSEMQVTIPAGVESGQTLRLAGKGEVAPGGTAGNLYIVLDVLPHARFTRRGGDLIVEAALSPELAARGGRVTVPMLVGVRDVEVPAGSRSGDEVVVPGCGIQIVGAPPTPIAVAGDAPFRALDTSGRGSLIVRLRVEQRWLRAWLRRLLRRLT